MCRVAEVVGVLLLLGWMGLTIWITYPIAWDWRKPSADWPAMWARAHRFGLLRWYGVLVVATAAFAVGALLDCPDT